MSSDLTYQALEELSRELNIIEELGDNDDASIRRIIIRSAFASIEALTSAIMSTALPALTDTALTDPKAANDPTTFLEIVALSDMSYSIDDRGSLKIEPLRAPLRNRLLFALAMLAKSNGVNLKPNQVSGWNDFLKAIKIRDRITHPSDLDDLSVSKEDYQIVITALQWAVRCHHRACGGTIF